MKRITIIALCLALLLLVAGCSNPDTKSQVVATTLPIFTFTNALCQGTDISVCQLITQDVSCLHDYTLKVPQMRAIEAAEILVISGAGLENFLSDTGTGKAAVINASDGIELLCHHADHMVADQHHHDADPHIWLSPIAAKIMAKNICTGLTAAYPQYAKLFQDNLSNLDMQLNELQAYADLQLSALSCRNIITFHDGFAYMAQAFDLTIVKAIEEEPGSEASAMELTELIQLVRANELPALFTETNGSTASASVISAESDTKIYPLSMAMSGDNYFELMYKNIDTLKEALG